MPTSPTTAESRSVEERVERAQAEWERMLHAEATSIAERENACSGCCGPYGEETAADYIEQVREDYTAIGRAYLAFSDAERTTPQGNVAAGEVERLRAALLRAREWLASAPLESGYCCCGSPVDGHGMGDGHSPVDELSYSAGQLDEELAAALNQEQPR